MVTSEKWVKNRLAIVCFEDFVIQAFSSVSERSDLLIPG